MLDNVVRNSRLDLYCSSLLYALQCAVKRIEGASSDSISLVLTILIFVNLLKGICRLKMLEDDHQNVYCNEKYY